MRERKNKQVEFGGGKAMEKGELSTFFEEKQSKIWKI